MRTTDRPDRGHADAGPAFCAACSAPRRTGDERCAVCGAHEVSDRLASDDTQELRVAPRFAGTTTTGHATVAVAGRGASGAVTCRACSAMNAPGRLLCGACGVDLDTGETGLAVEPATAGDAPVAGPPRRETAAGSGWRAVVFLIVACLVVAGAIVGALTALGIGPLAATDPDTVPTVTFDPARYPREPERLVLTDVATFTMRPPEGERTFTPERMVDGDPLSSWHQDASALPEDTLETIDLYLQDPAWITAIVFANGDHLEPDAYADAARLQRVDLVFDGDNRVAATLLDQGLEPQIVELGEPLLSTALRIELVSSVPGLEREDVALSGVALLGYAAEGDDAKAAGERAELRPAAGAVALPGP